jgi:hypothetical protein
MAPKKVFRRRVRKHGPGYDEASDVNVVVAMNVGSSRQQTVVSSRQRAVSTTGRRDPQTDRSETKEEHREEPGNGEEEVTT